MPIPTRRTVYVLARNREEFRTWAREHRSSVWRFEYLYHPQQFELFSPQGQFYLRLPGWSEGRGARQPVLDMIRVRRLVLAEMSEDGRVTPVRIIQPQQGYTSHVPVDVALAEWPVGTYEVYQRAMESMTRDLHVLPRVVDQAMENVRRGLMSVEEMRRASGLDGHRRLLSLVPETPFAEPDVQSAADADAVMYSARNWPGNSYGSTCAHVCAGEHICDVRASVDMTYSLPTGGRRVMPLCNTCYWVEQKLPKVAPTADASARPWERKEDG